MSFVVHMKAVVDRMLFQLGHKAGDINDCHRLSSSASHSLPDFRQDANVASIDPTRILDLFDALSSELADALADLDDWGLSGAKPGQYNHDVVADELILQPLLANGYRVLTEESGVVEPDTNQHEGITVVVDPVDGSTNASHGLPWYATSLCAVDDEGPLAAQVVNLATGRRFQAIRGSGVEIDTESAADRAFEPSGCTDLSDALLAFSGLPPAHGGWRQYRTYGAAALDICAVAGGSFDGFVDIDSAHGVWDYVGAQLICTEAGGAIADAEGRELVTLDAEARRAPVAAATPELLSQLLAMREDWNA